MCLPLSLSLCLCRRGQGGSCVVGDFFFAFVSRLPMLMIQVPTYLLG